MGTTAVVVVSSAPNINPAITAAASTIDPAKRHLYHNGSGGSPLSHSMSDTNRSKYASCASWPCEPDVWQRFRRKEHAAAKRAAKSWRARLMRWLGWGGV